MVAQRPVTLCLHDFKLIMLIAHVTDPHIGLRTNRMQAHPGTTEAFRRALIHVRQLVPAPDVLLLSGDLSETGREEDYITLAAIVEEELATLASCGPLVLAIPGNHDTPAVAKAVLGELMPVAADAPDGTMCLHVERGGLHFIGLDTVHLGFAHGHLNEAQLHWLEAQLTACAGHPVLLFMHHPPLVSGISAMDACGLLEGGPQLGKLVAAHGGVQLIAAGHVHRLILGTLGGAPVVVAPSSSHQIDLNLQPGAPLACRMEPPMIGLYRWSLEDGMACHFSHVNPFPGPFAI
ncbi:metallophosphoesterase [Ottowia thiooxydans]|uniref:metallophosphoesterase n=1 Tax=Ottowia thiooxydans TaxID=219182 RepID=UPI000419E4B0|nr:metallophosphoesterase [Ottowia thiooxydans]